MTAGAGKTYTLSSIHADAIGIVPRAGMEIFQRTAMDTAHDYSVSLSYIQVYQETIQVRPHVPHALFSFDCVLHHKRVGSSDKTPKLRLPRWRGRG
jgi:Kinesin motor domain